MKRIILITLLIITLMVVAMMVASTTAHAAELPTLDPAQPCGLVAAEYDRLLDGTALQGIGQALEDRERATRINGLFVMAIAAEESGWGKSRLARKCNNLCGINPHGLYSL